MIQQFEQKSNEIFADAKAIIVTGLIPLMAV